uniref:LssY-like C-terminal domain-containing protein n=1 Tax=Schlesneria paludicola TaxID=360056 RepID=A0A7C2P466_9PLAN
MSSTLHATHRTRRERASLAVGSLLAVYLAVAYLLLPAAWKWYVHRRPMLEDLPRITHTSSGIPGDPLNVSLTGTAVELKEALHAAGWFSADPLSLRSDVKIAEATVLKRPYEDAPVSNLYWNGRKEDLAFEKPVGDNPRQRHHVRFWNSGLADTDGRPVWLGSGTFDERVGLSHTTGQITHHIAADIDAEREHLFHDLEQTGRLASLTVQTGFHTQREGRNGGGDRWHTDGSLWRGVIRAAGDLPR